MGDRPEVDPQCFASDKLRVEIGGKRYEFPREMVRSMRGSSVSDTRHNDHGTTAFGYSACQKPGDVYWKLDSLDIKAIPLKCSDKKECYVKSIYLHIADIDYRRNRNPSDNIYPNDKISLLKECKAPVEPFNREHARTWSSCNYQLYTEEKYIGLTFRGGIYPPDKIDQTVQLVLKEIQKYEIKN